MSEEQDEIQMGVKDYPLPAPKKNLKLMGPDTALRQAKCSVKDSAITLIRQQKDFVLQMEEQKEALQEGKKEIEIIIPGASYHVPLTMLDINSQWYNTMVRNRALQIGKTYSTLIDSINDYSMCCGSTRCIATISPTMTLHLYCDEEGIIEEYQLNKELSSINNIKRFACGDKFCLTLPFSMKVLYIWGKNHKRKIKFDYESVVDIQVHDQNIAYLTSDDTHWKVYISGNRSLINRPGCESFKQKSTLADVGLSCNHRFCYCLEGPSWIIAKSESKECPCLAISNGYWVVYSSGSKLHVHGSSTFFQMALESSKVKEKDLLENYDLSSILSKGVRRIVACDFGFSLAGAGFLQIYDDSRRWTIEDRPERERTEEIFVLPEKEGKEEGKGLFRVLQVKYSTVFDSYLGFLNMKLQVEFCKVSSTQYWAVLSVCKKLLLLGKFQS